MNEIYQATYDAVSSKVRNGDLSDPVYRAILDCGFSHQVEMLRNDINVASNEYLQSISRPSVVYKPSLSVDGNKWCALYGVNLQDGVAGFGDSPVDAMLDFDKQWNICIN